jgi:anti-anti-sigma factor
MSQFECIELDNVEEVAVVKFTDEKIMDPARIEQLGKELLHLTDSDQNEKVVINFDNVKFFSSAAINKLIVLEKRMRARGGQMMLSNLRPEVRDLFNLTNLDDLFKIENEQSDAIKSLGAE